MGFAERFSFAEPLARPFRERLRRRLVALISQGGSGPVLDYDQPPGDPGLFGADSVTWRIHADFPGMMSGGVCALMLQTLHPLALAGVWDHSDFRHDLLGRLRRTTGFVGGTTYAPRAAAQQLIAQVVRIHRRVQGSAPDGRRYSASAPELLTWVHATEVASFLRGYQTYRGPVPLAMQDRYFAEASRLAVALGARDVPQSAAQMRAYFEQVQADLCFDERSREVIAVLSSMQLPVLGGPAYREVFLGAGAALLPDWAQKLMGRTRTQQLSDRAAARVLRLVAPGLRAALSEGVAARSCRRLGQTPQILQSWPPLS